MRFQILAIRLTGYLIVFFTVFSVMLTSYFQTPSRLSAIISGAVLGGLLLMGIAIWCCVRRRRHDGKGSYSNVYDDDDAAFSVHVPSNSAPVEGEGELPTLPYKD
jgi:hypothetical protein